MLNLLKSIFFSNLVTFVNLSRSILTEIGCSNQFSDLHKQITALFEGNLLHKFTSTSPTIRKIQYISNIY